ncbi:hypothetical protein [Pantoea sp. 18069]|uniref:hypothetical protein n=1 Tax=Pantoea sp. 18069 TaxID=2681415 RepID=UPI00135C7400|nr:hypothetical protein [Pantoea sp. 18069]
MKITVSGFTGAVNAPHPKLLPDTAGTVSWNQKPGRGDFRPWREPLEVATVPAARKTIYRFGRDVAEDGRYWFAWTGTVHAVRGMLADDTTERTYYSGDGFPKWTDNTIALAGGSYPAAWRKLGVPPPTSAPTLQVSEGDSTETEVRYYVYTFVTDKGEESAPGPVSLMLTCPINAVVAISGIESPPSGALTIDRVRIYRTQTGSTGDTEFFFLRELAAGAATTSDDKRVLGEILETVDWLQPPEDLTWLTAMWNGMIAGITGNAVRYCMAYKPYAWPIAYETLPPDAKPVALATFGQRLLVLTTADPVLVAGTSPDSLDEQPLEVGQACVAPRAVVSFGHGVAWPAPDGLAYYGAAGAKLVTAGILTRDDWQAMNPAGMVAGLYEGLYLSFFTDAGGVRRGFLVDPQNPAGIFYLERGYDALYLDELQDALYVLDGNQVLKWDAGAALMSARFVSKVFGQSAPVSPAWCKVAADSYPVTVKINALELDSREVAQHIVTYGSPRCISVSSGNSSGVQFTLAAQGPEAFRLPAIAARSWQIEVSGEQAVQGVSLAQSVEEWR